MAYSITRSEMKTTIRWDAEEKVAHIWTRPVTRSESRIEASKSNLAKLQAAMAQRNRRNQF